MIRNEFYVDVTTLNDRELNSHIRRLQDKRVALLNQTKPHSAKSMATNGPVMEASEIAILLLISTAEKNSRSAKKQAKASIDLSRETKALAKASLEQAKQFTKLSRETMELTKASHDVSQKMERLAKVAVGVALFSVFVAVVGIWQ